jgi:hypothetical protein
MDAIPSTRYRFPPVITQYGVWLYAQFMLLFRDVEEPLAVFSEVRARSLSKFDVPVGAPAIAGTSTRWSSGSVIESTSFGTPSMTKTGCWNSWSRSDAELGREGKC